MKKELKFVFCMAVLMSFLMCHYNMLAIDGINGYQFSKFLKCWCFEWMLAIFLLPFLSKKLRKN